MTQASPNAIRLAAWIYATHPKLFQKLLAKANAAKAGASKAKNISGFGCNCPPQALRGFGAAPGFGDLTLQPIDISAVTSATDPVSSALTDTSGSSGGFWSGLGSDLSSIGSDVLSGVGSVGSYLTSGSGLSSLTGLANTYFASQAVQSQANTQQAVLQAQAQRVASGYSPAPVTYQQNAQGQLVPVYQSASGYTPLNSSGIAALTTGLGGLPSWALPVGLGVAGLLIFMKFSK